jgi:putative membrane protein
MKYAAIIGVLACALSAAPVVSAQSTTPATPKPAQGTKPSTSKPDAAAQKSSVAATDTTFAKQAAMDGMAEVEHGRLASEKASNSDVKQFGARMVEDHGKANDELKSWASTNGVTLPADMGAQHKAMHAKLSKMSGDAFDRAYAAHMVTAHAKAVSSFQSASKTAKNADLKAWAAKTLPTLQEHHKMARDINAKVGTASKPTAKKSGGR